MKGASPLTRKEIQKVLRATTSIRERAMLTLGFSTGFRVSALLSLTVEDVSTNGVIHNRVTARAKFAKTKVGHSVILNSDCKKALETLLDWLKSKGADDKTPLFLSRRHTATGELKAISRQRCHDILKELFALVGLVGGEYSAHSMRKSLAKFVYDTCGGRIEKVAAALGHRSLTSTISYLSFNHSDLDNALLSMEF